MERLALIIVGHSNSAEEKETDIYFANSYSQFFNSVAGGAWDNDEILFFNEPSFDDIASLIKNVNPSYAVTVLIGHGANQTNHQLFKLNEDTIIKPGQFVFNTDKQLIILESCRSKIEDLNWVDLENKIPTYKYGGLIRGHIDRETSKFLFNSHLNSCETGVVICYACSTNQVARDFIFSTELIQFGQNLFLDTWYHYRTFGILDMMPNIIENVSAKTKELQQPEIIGSVNFPFAVSKFDLVDYEKKQLSMNKNKRS